MKIALLFLLTTACDQKVEVDKGESADSGATQDRVVTITVDGDSAEVSLSSVDTIHPEDDDVVAVTTLLDASGLDATWSERTYSFVASDGFTPADVGCDPVDYTTVQGAWLYPASGNLAWDSTLGMRGCYFVNDITAIQALDAG